MEIIRYQPEHLLELDLRSEQAKQLGHVTDDYAAMLVGPHSYTGIVDGQIIGSAGVMQLWPGVGEAWACLGDQLGQHAIAASRHTQRILRQLLDGNRFHRIQTVTADGFHEAEAWAVFLGFKYEGLMARYGRDRHDYHRWAMVA